MEALEVGQSCRFRVLVRTGAPAKALLERLLEWSHLQRTGEDWDRSW